MSTDSLFLVRHAKAGHRSDFRGPDAERPLVPAGHRQAKEIAGRLGEMATTLLSSPAVRCRQTLEPLAAAIDGAVVEERRLAEGTAFEDTLELIASAPAGTVMCSHGDVIPEVIDALVRRGARLVTKPDWRKATVWTLRRRGDTIVEAGAWHPES